MRQSELSLTAGTTLLPAQLWLAAALLLVLGVELAALASGGEAAWLAPSRYIAATLTLCPAIAVVGAKRPQHTAWTFVVLSLWGIVALPALTTLAMQRSSQFVISDARGLFLWGLVLLGLANYLPTKFWLAALFYAGMQACLLLPHLTLASRLGGPFPWVGLAGGVVAVMIAWHVSRRPRPNCQKYDLLWLDFRDAFGLLWGLRVQERINAAAVMYGWDLELTWGGFQKKSDGSATVQCAEESFSPTDDESGLRERSLKQTLHGLLRRFVSGDWIAARLSKGLD